MRLIPDTSNAPLVWRACLALNGEEDPELVGEYLQQAIAALEEISGSLSRDKQKRRIGQLRIFLRVLQIVLSSRGGTRSALVFQKRRGRPRRSLADVQRGLLAVDMVNHLVANGIKQESAIAEASDKLGLGRSDVFAWLKIVREIDPGLGDLYPE